MVNIQLQGSVASALAAQANHAGLSLEAYLAQIAGKNAGAQPPAQFDGWERELDELSIDAPPLPADFSRADIYLDHD
jgi:hypothetical protein